MGSMGNQNPATVPNFALHLIKLEQVAGGALATFQVLDRDPLQQMAVTVYTTNDTDGTGGMISRAREEAINLLRRSICLLHAERTVEGEGHSEFSVWPGAPRAAGVSTRGDARGQKTSA